MDMNYLRGILSKLCPKSSQKEILLQKQALSNVLELYDKGEFEGAYKTLCDVMNNPPEWLNIGCVYAVWSELALLANEDAYRALELLDRAKELGGLDMASYHYVRGDALIHLRDYEKAIENLERSISLDPNVANLTMFAQALSETQDSRSLNIWQKVLEKEPENCLAHIYIGLEALKSGDRSKAMFMAKRAEKLNPSVEDIFTIGILYHELGDFQTALNKYLFAHKLGFKDKTLVYSSIAACYLSMGDVKPARKYAEWALKSDPENEYAKEIWHEYKERFGE